MDRKLSKIRAEWEKRRSVPRAIVGVQGNFNSVVLKQTLRHIIIQEHVFMRLLIGFSLALFGPGLMYMYITEPVGWNTNLPVYVEIMLVLSMVFASVFSFKFLFMPSKVLVDQLSGRVEIKKSPLHVARIIEPHQIASIQSIHSTYTHKGVTTDLYTATLTLTTEEKVGLFITSKVRLIEEFLERYPQKECLKQSA